MAKEPVPIKFPPDVQLADRLARVVDIARRFPGVEESRSYGTPAIKVKRKLPERHGRLGTVSLRPISPLGEVPRATLSYPIGSPAYHRPSSAFRRREYRVVQPGLRIPVGTWA